ncbi:uncharacterized protein JCM10292_005035 [Rhodotorula paludigena]|uniref:uncharacterized protein n=1 Tax=Rhodotorula paludigena TaxID=86838 RepID=UPI00316D19B2
MGFFLRGRVLTHVLVGIGMLCSGFATFVYAWQLSRSWPNPSNFTKVMKIFAMVFHAMFAAQSILTWHSLRVSSKSLSFGLWTVLGFGTIVLDGWWFGLMTSRNGYNAVCGDEDAQCVRKNILITFTVYLAIYGLYRLYIIISVFSFDVHYNEMGLPPPPSTPTAAPTTAATPVMQYAHPMAAAPGAYGAAMMRSLSKRFRPSRISRQRWEELATWRAAGDTGRERGRGGSVPLINVSMHEGDEETLVGNRRKSREEPYRDEQFAERQVLFDADSPAPSSVGGATPLGERGDPLAGTRKDSSELSSSSDELESDEDEQAAYEQRRKERKGAYRQV